ncbi:M4 family metallopeptidase [Fibrella aquatilis]|uniref:M4 family metallopeptidase n=1 Tax=Fibrella aquatilis TaxID=2817059 RepID=A0A939JYR2_9BACT|nr:M4 family metallopeptidase [Fibrella aquatilis]MBO0929410.1 M4 family metallopeptidase [Fibrella aquatilis]
MKHVLYLTALTAGLTGTTAWAQQPQLANPSDLATRVDTGVTVTTGVPGFSRKLKTAPADPALAQRLGATEAPLPANRIQPLTLTATGKAPVDVPPLRLKIVRDSRSGLPIYIENLDPRPGLNRNGRRSMQATAYAFLGQIKGLLGVKDPEQSLQIRQTIDDDMGQTHYRLSQTHRGVPVYGAELAVHLTNGEVTLVNGQYQPIPTTLDVQPELSLTAAGKAALRDVGKTIPVRMFGQNILKMEPVTGELCIYAGTSDQPAPARLAYDLTVRPNLLQRWQYVIDAQTGAVLAKHNNTCSIDGSKDASARDLNGVTRSFKTYLYGTNYIMLDASRAMYDKNKSKLPDAPVGGLWTIDAANTYGDNLAWRQVSSTNNTNWSPTATSAQYNVGVAYEYFLKTFNRKSINDKNGTITSIINVNDPETGKGMDNAYWNGEYMLYGNGDKGFKPLAGALDVAGHEMSHGVIQNTANLTYQGQSGALNESFADVFGVLIDRANWNIGEDVVVKAYFPSGALRSMSNPNQGGTNDNGYQPKTMAQYDNTTEDNGGVHINSGIPNYAFFLFANNASVGKDKAEQVYYKALTQYLTRSSKFLDMRLAVIRAATDIHGANSAEVTAAKAAFDAVGIVEGSSTPVDPKPTIPASTGQDFISLVSVGDGKLYTTPYPIGTFTARSTSKLLRRPSVTDDGKLAVFVGSDGKIRASSLTNPASETVVSQEAGWANVAVSKDGTRLAALTDKQDGKIYVYSFDLSKWQTFKLYNPTTAQGIKTGEVAYADSFEWDYTGEYIIYDAYNKLKNATGTAVDYWDVGIMRAWDGAKKNFADGTIEKLFTDLDEGVSIGNPSFAKTAPNVVAFDYFDENDQSNYVLGANIETSDVQVIYENNTLGFPSYSRTDNAVVFGTLDKNNKESVALMGVGADKITATGTAATPLVTGAKWPVWYSNVARALPTRVNQTLTFNLPSSRFLSEGDLTLSATSSANLPVSFKVMSGPATLAGNVLKMSSAGAVTVRAFQDGNAQTFAATPVDRSIDVQQLLATEPAWLGDVRLFPNPTRSRLTVELPTGVAWQTADLISTAGAVVQQHTNAVQKPLELDVSALPTGLYVITIDTDKGRIQRKVVRE